MSSGFRIYSFIEGGIRYLDNVVGLVVEVGIQTVSNEDTSTLAPTFRLNDVHALGFNRSPEVFDLLRQGPSRRKIVVQIWMVRPTRLLVLGINFIFERYLAR
jgi:hypothetical protein